MGQLFSDYVGSECGRAVGQAGEAEAEAAKGAPAHLPIHVSPPPRPHHLYLLQPGWPVHPGVQPGFHVEASRQGHGGAARGVSSWGCGAPPPTSAPGKAQAPLIPSTPRYTGHKNQEYKLDCCLSERDTHVVSFSEDGKVFFWDLVEVSLSTPTLHSVPILSLLSHPQTWKRERYQNSS